MKNGVQADLRRANLLTKTLLRNNALLFSQKSDP